MPCNIQFKNSALKELRRLPMEFSVQIARDIKKKEQRQFERGCPLLRYSPVRKSILPASPKRLDDGRRCHPVLSIGSTNSCSATVMHCTQCFTVELQLWLVGGLFSHRLSYAHGCAQALYFHIVYISAIIQNKDFKTQRTQRAQRGKRFAFILCVLFLFFFSANFAHSAFKFRSCFWFLFC